MTQKYNKPTKRYIIMTGFNEAAMQIIPDDDPLRVKKFTFYLHGNIKTFRSFRLVLASP